MSGNVVRELCVTEQLLNHLRCSACHMFLSVCNIYLLPDGRDVCQSCRSNDGSVPYRQLSLEKILQYGIFRCKFAKYHCSFTSSLEFMAQHEVVCQYSPVCCGPLTGIQCSWVGASRHFPYHFITEHIDPSGKPGDFKLHLEKSSQGLAIAASGENIILFKYSYNANAFLLHYVTGHFGSDYEQQLELGTWKSDTINPWRRLAGIKSFRFNPLTFDIRRALKVEMQYVGNFKDVTIRLRTKPAGHLLEVVEPALVQQEFPCRWLDCVFEDIKSEICEHEAKCSHRIYSCMYPKCGALMNRKSVVQHMKNHQCKELVGQYVYLTCFDTDVVKEAKEPLYLFCFKNDEIFLIKTYIAFNQYHLLLESSSFKDPLISVQVRFIHTHYPNTDCSSLYATIDGLTIDFNDFPSCFQYKHPITVSIEFVW